MPAPAKLTIGPSHAIDRIRKRRKGGRINPLALGAGISLDEQGRLVVDLSGAVDSVSGIIGGNIDDFVLARSTKSAAAKVYAWSAFK